MSRPALLRMEFTKLHHMTKALVGMQPRQCMLPQHCLIEYWLAASAVGGCIVVSVVAEWRCCA
jgi:hypothetical protein